MVPLPLSLQFHGPLSLLLVLVVGSPCAVPALSWVHPVENHSAVVSRKSVHAVPAWIHTAPAWVTWADSLAFDSPSRNGHYADGNDPKGRTGASGCKVQPGAWESRVTLGDRGNDPREAPEGSGALCTGSQEPGLRKGVPRAGCLKPLSLGFLASKRAVTVAGVS